VASVIARETGDGGTKECRFCAETIKARAVRCRYCGSDVDSDSETNPSLDKIKAEFRCPRCESASVDIRRRGVSEWRGIITYDLVSMVAPDWALPLAFAGATGDRKELQYKCLNCGHSALLGKALAENGPRQADFPDGRVIHFTLREGKREGEYRILYGDGQLAELGAYTRGKVNLEAPLWSRMVTAVWSWGCERQG